jgi:WD40 repeat protein
MLTFGSPDTIWDVETGKKVGELPAMFLTPSPDGKKIAAGPLSEWYESGSVGFDIIVDAETGKQLCALPGDFNQFSPDSTKVVVWTRNGTRTICDAETGKKLYVLTDVLPKMSLNFSLDGKKIAVLNENSTRILDAESGKELRALPEKYLGFTPDGKRIVTSTGATVRIWILEQ